MTWLPTMHLNLRKTLLREMADNTTEKTENKDKILSCVLYSLWNYVH